MKKGFSDKMEIALILAGLFVCALAYVLFEKTVMSVWMLVFVFCIGAVVMSPLLGRRWSWVDDCDSGGWFTVVWHTIYTGLMSVSLFVIANYYVPFPGCCVYSEEVYVEKKTMEPHRKTHRVGKHRYVSDGVYYEYCLEVVFNDGTRSTVSVPHATYYHARQGGKVELKLRKGIFGFVVLSL